MKYVSTLPTSLRSLGAGPYVSWGGVKHATTGRWSAGNVLSGVINRASLFSRLLDESGLCGWQEDAAYRNA